MKAAITESHCDTYYTGSFVPCRCTDIVMASQPVLLTNAVETVDWEPLLNPRTGEASDRCLSSARHSPRGGRVCLMYLSSLESQGCHLSLLYYLLSCSSSSFCLVFFFFCPLAHGGDTPRPPPPPRILQYFSLSDRLFGMTVV